MTDPFVLIQILAVLALIAAPIVGVVRLLSGPDLDRLEPPVRSARLPWPAGVQEEDSVRFRLGSGAWRLAARARSQAVPEEGDRPLEGEIRGLGAIDVA